MNDRRDYFLASLLDCGTADLSLLDRIGYDISELVEEIRRGWPCETRDVTLSSIVIAAIEKGIEDLQDAIDLKVSSMFRLLQDDDHACSNEERAKLSECVSRLRELDPHEDIFYEFNYLCTHAWIQNNAEIYSELLADELDEIEDLVGFAFER